MKQDHYPTRENYAGHQDMPEERALDLLDLMNSSQAEDRMRVLMITSEYPDKERPNAVPFIVRQVEYLRRRGIDIELFAFKGRKKLTNYVRASTDLRRFIAGKQFDLVHAQWGQSAFLALPKTLPWVITFRGNDLEGIVGPKGYTTKGRILTVVSKLMARLADERIVVSKSLGEQLGGRSFTVIPSGLDLELFKPLNKEECRRDLRLAPDKKLVLFAATSIENPRKRFDLAREAVEKLNEKYDIDMVVADRVDHSMVPKFMSACDVLLLTSIHEGSPNVVKEALACDLPVVSTDVGDVRQRIGGIDGCKICDDESAAGIAAALDEVLARGRRIEGRKHVADLDENNITDRLITIYRRALSNYHADEAGNREVIKNTEVSAPRRG